MVLCGRLGACCVKAKALKDGGLKLEDKQDGRKIVLTETERDELRKLMVHGVL